MQMTNVDSCWQPFPELKFCTVNCHDETCDRQVFLRWVWVLRLLTRQPAKQIFVGHIINTMHKLLKLIHGSIAN